MSRMLNNGSMFDVEKSIASIGYLVEKTNATMYPVMKMLYLADKIHLERYGRFISGDSYVAMKQGPVPSNAYNLMKVVRGDFESEIFSVARRYFGYDAASHAISLKCSPDLDELSVSDRKCLDDIIKVYSELGKWAVRDMSHDDAWEKIWGSGFFIKSRPMPVEVIASQFDCAKELISHLKDSSPGEAEETH